MSLTYWGVLFFLAASLLFYVILGGADFGAGILELFLRRRRGGAAPSTRASSDFEAQQKLISHAMAPVWEANHVWLILAIVILFMGFPPVYEILSVYLHLPVMAVLVGIVGRGCAFTFRYYDTLTRKYYSTYSRIFAYSSLWTSMFLGITGGALILGRINPAAATYDGLYVAPWFNFFCMAMGVFTSCLFAFLAAVFLSGEAKDPELQGLFRQKAAVANGFVILAGALVFVSAELEGLSLARSFFESPISLACFVTATALLVPFWKRLKRPGFTLQVRVMGVAIVAMVLLGWYAVQYPIVVRLAAEGLVPGQGDGDGGLSFSQAAAPEATLRALLGALVVGSALIFPALAYLLKVFKWETFERQP